MDAPEITDAELKLISSLARRQWQLEQEIAKLEETVKEKTKELNEVRDRDLPNALAEAGCSVFGLDNGFMVKVKMEVFASIPQERASEAFGWLRNNDFGSLIKNVISAEFGKGEDEDAIKAAMVLAEAGFKPSQKESVHPMTLKAFLKEQLEKGTDIPVDLFGAYIVHRSKIEAPKK